jgi:Flp pilus assembly protein TadG
VLQHRRLIARRDGERGFTAVEFALIIPLFFALLLGAIDGGRLIFSRCMVSHAALVAARTASVRKTTTLSAVTAAAAAAAPILTLASTNVYFNGSSSAVANDTSFNATKPTAPGSTVTVTVQYSYQPLTGAFVHFGSRQITGTSRVGIE